MHIWQLQIIEEALPPTVTGKLYLGATQIHQLYLGATQIKKVYLGSTVVYSDT